MHAYCGRVLMLKCTRALNAHACLGMHTATCVPWPPFVSVVSEKLVNERYPTIFRCVVLLRQLDPPASVRFL